MIQSQFLDVIAGKIESLQLWCMRMGRKRQHAIVGDPVSRVVKDSKRFEDSRIEYRINRIVVQKHISEGKLL